MIIRGYNQGSRMMSESYAMLRDWNLKDAGVETRGHRQWCNSMR
jgi:hypothetical protein